MTLQHLNEGDVTYIQGSGKKPYEIKKVGGVVSCSCPAWRNLGGSIDTRVCKHIKANIDPGCLLPQAVNPPTQTAAPATVRLTKTGKVSTAVGGAVKKDTAPPCLLAHKWEGEDPTGWWMSEKLDGVRAWWDGEKFVSRLGNVYHAPEWFKALLPNVVLDGELWVGRKQFQKTISAVRKLVPTDSEWLDVQFVMFDAPNLGGSFEDRIEYLENLFPTLRHNGAEGTGMVSVLQQIKCKSAEHLKELLKEIEARGGEGVMLREAGSLYEADRSHTCLKVKTFTDDEAEVIGYTDGKGKHKGRVGALEVRWGDKEFEVGTGLTDKERENPPSVGAKITFRYQELTDKGIPRFPSYIGVRDYE
jgi:DNA ligase 1